MKKLLLLIIFFSQFIFLSGCQLAKKDKDEQSDTNNKTQEIVAFKIQMENSEEDDYYTHRVNPIINNTMTQSPFIQGIHVRVFFDETTSEEIEVSYYSDLDTNNCFTLSNIVEYEHHELKEESSKGICGLEESTLEYESEDGMKTATFLVHFIDIDYLESYQVIQYNINNEKIKDETITLNKNEEIKITITKDTEDFIVVEKYKDHNQNTYYKRALYSKEELLGNQNPLIYHRVYALDEENNRACYKFDFSVEEEIGGDV